MSSTMFPWFIPTFFVRFDFSVFYREFSSTFFFAFFLAFPALCGRWEEASVSSAALATNCWHRRACNSTIEWPWRWRWWWSNRFRTLPPEELHRSILSSWPRHANEAATLSAIGPHTPYSHSVPLPLPLPLPHRYLVVIVIAIDSSQSLLAAM